MMCAYSGPLPPPEMLKKYGDIVPDAPERIIQMAEKQGLHRMEIEKELVIGNSHRENKGMWFGFIISLTAIIGGIILILNDKSATGITTILFALASLVGAFIYSKLKTSQEIQEKEKDVNNKKKD